MTSGSGKRRPTRGEIEELPSGSLRVRVYAGIDPATRKRRYLQETVPAGPAAGREAEAIRVRLLQEVRAARETQAGARAGGAAAGAGGAEGASGRRRRPVLDPASADPRHAPTTGSPLSQGQPRGLTVAGIAHLAGVSAPTVSKVLNGRPGVAPETRRRVEELLRAQSYRRPEKVTRAACVEVVFYSTLSQLAVEIMRGVKQVTVHHGLAVGFTDVLREAATGRDWSQDLLARRPAGVVAVHLGAAPEQLGLLSASGIPLVIVDPTSEPLERIPWVSAANRQGGIAAARHLLDLGHRRIAVISGPPERLSARGRLDGVRAALDAAGLPLEKGLTRTGIWFSFEDGLSHGRELLRLSAPPTAVLCGNDLQAFGVYEAARQAGVSVPDQLSVVGFDDISYARWCGPPLTTVQQPFAEMGTTAAELVLALAAGETVAHAHVELATTLVVRDSTAPPPG
jgi:LacI family xylobiose transport system transcriptional regulator